MRRSLRAKTIVFTVALALLPVLILSLTLLGLSYYARRSDVLDRQQNLALQQAKQMSLTLGEIQQALDVVARTSDWESLSTRDQQLLVDTLYAYQDFGQSGDTFGALDEVLLLDREGQPVAGRTSIRLMSLDNWASEVRATAYATIMQDQEYRGEVYISPGAVSTLNVAVPMRDLPGRITGLLWGAINLDKALWPVITGPGLPDETHVYALDEQGYIVVRNDQHVAVRDEALDRLLPTQQAGLGAVQGVATYAGLAGEEVVGAWEPVAGTSWTLVVETPARLAFADIRALLLPALLLVLVTVGVAGTAGIAAGRFLTRPVEGLRAGAEIIGQGNLDHRIEISSQDEIGSLAQAFNQMAANLQHSHQELERWGQKMEERVEERTHELAAASEQMQRRATQLQASAEVARAITSVRDLDELLPQVTQLVSQRFSWYHVGIFLLDPSREYAILRAANSPGGQQMLARGHRLKVGEAGIVGFVTATGQPRIALDVGQDAVYFDTPELQSTRSEMALPLQIGNRIIGALDVQSLESGAYDNEDVVLLTLLADQIAIAIENARRFEETQQALEEVRRLHRLYVEREWAKTSSGPEELRYEYRRGGLPPSGAEMPPEMLAALKQGQITASPHPAQAAAHDNRPSLAAPIKYRDQVIGALNLEEEDADRRWTEDDIALVTAVSDQLGLALENARLFTEAQRRADQMSTLNRIGLDLASGLELERVLESLYEQCSQAFDVDTFYVAFYEKETGTLHFPLLIRQGGAASAPAANIQQEPGLAGHVLETGQVLHIPDTQAMPARVPYQPRPLTEQPNRSYLGVPLSARGRVFGILAIQSQQPNAYADEDIELLATIATQATIAIENAQTYQQLVETADQLRELDRLKTQFLANMSHELRTPLNSIIGFSRVMLKGIDGPLTEMQETDLTSIYNSGQHLLSLINSVLDMSKIEAGKMDLSFEAVDLHPILKTAISTTTALIKDSPIELHTDIPDSLPAVRADAQRVRQILINLLSNAAKFTEEGTIRLQAEAGSEFVTISVHDTGIGISEEAQQQLFVPFQQVDPSATRRAGGTGLGLAICRRFVQLHGGDIWLESEPGAGSTFSFTLPIHETAREEPPAPPDTGKKANGNMVLAIDDDGGVITLLKRYLESDGYQVTGVQESRRAVETAQRLAPSLTAITLDVVMPNLDGWQVLQALKENPQTREIPVILCSIVEDLDQGLGMGAAACLRKPVTRDDVLSALKQIKG